MANPLTSQQKKVLDAFKTWLLENNNETPTHQELADAIGCARTTVTVHLKSLERKGYIARSRQWRDLSLIQDASLNAETSELKSQIDKELEPIYIRLENLETQINKLN